ncbi:MAG: hypothetical protein KA984_00105 [Candidatus Cloacimonetes bacterium]|nr:hypothetical protein [Candidatus Cloacimonadota bacterium]
MIRKIILLGLMVLCAMALSAQVGLFNLEYAMPLAQADSLLINQGFMADGQADGLVRYKQSENEYVSALILFVEPTTERIVGWFVKYNAANSEENDDFVLRHLQELHGETNVYDEETQQLIWFLSTTRNVFVVYSEYNELTVLYYDSHFPEIFKLNKDKQPVQDFPDPALEE